MSTSKKNTSQDNKQSQLGDMQIKSDSTFHFQGEKQKASDTVSGWNTGEDLTGTWEQPDSSRIKFWLNPKEDKMFLAYTIIQLTETKLVLRSWLSKDNRKSNIVFRRL